MMPIRIGQQRLLFGNVNTKREARFITARGNSENAKRKWSLVFLLSASSAVLVLLILF